MTKEELDTLRFNVPRGKKVVKDAFITGMMELFFVRSQIGIFAGKGRVAKLLQPAADLLQLERAAENEADRALFVDAYKETALTFIKIGRRDKSYSTGILNLMQISFEQFRDKVKGDFHLIGTELPEKGGREDLFAPFREGLALAFEEYFSDPANRD